MADLEGDAVNDKAKPIGSNTETRIIEALEASQEATRRHISAEFDTVRNDVAIGKVRIDQIKTMMRRLLRVFGIGSEDIL